MRKIVAVGGGEIGSAGAEGTLSIDTEIIKLTGKKSPRLLFIPTASSDAVKYTQIVEKYFGQTLGCDVEPLYLLKTDLSAAHMQQKILSADIIYVGGGNTLMMMRRWRHLGVDKMLLKAYKQGTMMSGLSAGALCWFEYGHSDSMSNYSPDNWDYIRVKCLNFIPLTLCPHYDGEKRDVNFRKMMEKTGGVGVALDNYAAIEIIDDSYRIITSKPSAKAYKVYKKNNEVIQIEISKVKDFTPLTKLYRVS